MRLPVYLDYHATTPVDPRVVEAMLPFFTERFGNASSRSHRFGRDAAAAVDEARGQVAALVECDPGEVVFTGGATESDNLAIKGVAAFKGSGQLITTAVEHSAVLDSCDWLKRWGFEITILPVDGDGLVDPDHLRRALTDRTILVSIQLANNEIGVIQPLEELIGIARERGVPVHTDAVQGAGRIPTEGCSADFISLTAHKMYGPKGTGALIVRRGASLEPTVHGGGQEHGFRSGTLNVPGIVGFGKACELAREELPAEAVRIQGLRDRLEDRLFGELPDLLLNSHPEHRLPGNLSLAFLGIDAEALIGRIPELALSAGAACHSGGQSISHVLTAIGRSKEQARASVRFGLGRWTTEEEVDFAAGRVIEQVCRLRGTGDGLSASDTHTFTSPDSHTISPSTVLSGEARDEARGDRVRLRIWVDSEERIRDAHSRVFGCEYTLRCADQAVEWLRGRTLQAALEISQERLLQAVAVPAGREFCAALVEQAVKAAVANHSTSPTG